MMNTPTLEQVYEAARLLPIAEQQLLVQLLKPLIGAKDGA